MSNFVYDKAKEGFLNGKFNFSQKSFKLLFVNNNYSPNQNLDEFISNIDPSYIVYRSANLSNVTNNNGIIDANDISFTLPSNIGFNSIILCQVETLDNQSRLITYIDTAAGLPYSGSPQEVVSTIVWSNLSGKILSI